MIMDCPDGIVCRISRPEQYLCFPTSAKNFKSRMEALFRMVYTAKRSMEKVLDHLDTQPMDISFVRTGLPIPPSFTHIPDPSKKKERCPTTNLVQQNHLLLHKFVCFTNRFTIFFFQTTVISIWHTTHEHNTTYFVLSSTYSLFFTTFILIINQNLILPLLIYIFISLVRTLTYTFISQAYFIYIITAKYTQLFFPNTFEFLL